MRLVSPTLFRLSLVVSIFLATNSSYAHGELPFTRTIFLEDGQLVGGAANYGLLQSTPTSTLWTTEDTVGSEPRLFHRLPDGTILAAGFTGLMQTDDWGCSWTEVPFFSGHVLSSLIESPSDPFTLFVLTASRDLDNGVFKSSDGGETWEPIGELFSDISLKSMVVSAENNQLWVQGFRQDDWSLVVFHFSSNDEQWNAVGVDTAPYKRFTLLGLSNSAIMVGAQTSADQGLLLISNDGLNSTTELARFGSTALTHYVANDHYQFVTTTTFDNISALWRAKPGEVFEPVLGPGLCLKAGDGNTLWGCGNIQSGGHFLKTNHGESWKMVHPFPNACAYECPGDTPGAELNSDYAIEMAKYGVGTSCGEGAATNEPAETKSGCQAVGPGLGWLITMGLLYRRRRHT